MKTNSLKHNWGGEWTEKKLNAFSKYVEAYLSIMNKNKYWKTIYFDGFAGSGSRDNEQVQFNSLYKELFTDEVSYSENLVYKGSAERVVSLSKKFDYYYFIDINQDALSQLEERLKDYSSNLKIDYRNDNANNQLCKLAEAMKSKQYASLVFLDPFAMEVSWDSIKKLENTRTDIWVLVPTGTIINRLLDKKGEVKSISKLTNFFGLTEEEIKKYFYTTKRTNTLFGESEIVSKVHEPIKKIAKIYIQQLKTIWQHTTEKPLVLLNSKNVPIFHFIFASNNIHAVKIASEIIKSI